MSESRSFVLIDRVVLDPIVYKPILESPLVMIWRRVLHFYSHRLLTAGLAGIFALRNETRIDEAGSRRLLIRLEQQRGQFVQIIPPYSPLVGTF